MRRPLGPASRLAGVGLAAGAAVHLAPAVVGWRAMRCRLTPTLAGVGDPGHVALTFDDGPDPESTPAVMEALDRLGWRATFFVLGSQTRLSPGLLGELVAAGHELGIHGDRHVNHLRRPLTSTLPDVRRARDLVEDLVGAPVRWFRPPYGALAAPSVAAAAATGLQTVLWTTWGRDWRGEATPGTVAADIRRTWWPGATVLLHDSDVTSAPGSWRATLGALPALAHDWDGLEVGPLADHGLALAPAVRRRHAGDETR